MKILSLRSIFICVVLLIVAMGAVLPTSSFAYQLSDAKWLDNIYRNNVGGQWEPMPYENRRLLSEINFYDLPKGQLVHFVCNNANCPQGFITAVNTWAGKVASNLFFAVNGTLQDNSSSVELQPGLLNYPSTCDLNNHGDGVSCVGYQNLPNSDRYFVIHTSTTQPGAYTGEPTDYFYAPVGTNVYNFSDGTRVGVSVQLPIGAVIAAILDEINGGGPAYRFETDIIFNSNKPFNRGYTLAAIGSAVGLRSVNDTISVMFDGINTTLTELTDDDVEGLRAQYGYNGATDIDWSPAVFNAALDTANHRLRPLNENIQRVSPGSTFTAEYTFSNTGITPKQNAKFDFWIEPVGHEGQGFGQKIHTKTFTSFPKYGQFRDVESITIPSNTLCDEYYLYARPSGTVQSSTRISNKFYVGTQSQLNQNKSCRTSISGKIFDDFNSDGIQNNGEQLLKGSAMLFARRGYNNIWTLITEKSNSLGTYTFTDLNHSEGYIIGIRHAQDATTNVSHNILTSPSTVNLSTYFNQIPSLMVPGIYIIPSTQDHMEHINKDFGIRRSRSDLSMQTKIVELPLISSLTQPFTFTQGQEITLRMIIENQGPEDANGLSYRIDFGNTLDYLGVVGREVFIDRNTLQERWTQPFNVGAGTSSATPNTINLINLAVPVQNNGSQPGEIRKIAIDIRARITSEACRNTGNSFKGQNGKFYVRVPQAITYVRHNQFDSDLSNNSGMVNFNLEECFATAIPLNFQPLEDKGTEYEGLKPKGDTIKEIVVPPPTLSPVKINLKPENTRLLSQISEKMVQISDRLGAILQKITPTLKIFNP